MKQKLEGIWLDVWAKAKDEGIAEGKAEGRAEGVAEGEAKGRAETIREFVQSNRKSRMSRKRILSSLEKHFSLKPEEAMSYL